MPSRAAPKMAQAAPSPLKHAASHGAGAFSLQLSPTPARAGDDGFRAAQPPNATATRPRITPHLRTTAMRASLALCAADLVTWSHVHVRDRRPSLGQVGVRAAARLGAG